MRQLVGSLGLFGLTLERYLLALDVVDLQCVC
jgi:hypothetical protein